MWRVLRGPSAADRMLAALLFGTTGVAVLMLSALALAQPPIVDVALVLALLAAIAGVAFARRAWRAPVNCRKRRRCQKREGEDGSAAARKLHSSKLAWAMPNL